MSVKCGGRGLEIAGYKKRCSICELPVAGKIFHAHVLFVLNGIFAGPLKRMKSAKIWPNRSGSS